MARKASGKKTGVAEKATAAEVETTAAAQAETATGNEQGTETDPALVNTGDTGVDNETVTAGSEAEVETTADETGGASDETDDSTGETDDDEDDPEKVKQEPKTGTGFQFNVSSDGFVEVISEKRAGKSVTGATGEIITFDDKGYAKVKLEDAIHFSQVPGFSFK